MNSLVIYTSPTCGPCKILKPKLRSLCQRLDLPLVERDIAVPSEMTMAKADGVRGVPAVVHQGKVLFMGNIDEPDITACLQANGVI